MCFMWLCEYKCSKYFSNRPKTGRKFRFNNLLTYKLLIGAGISLPLRPVISFSVINYVVSRGIPTRVAKSLSFFYNVV